MGNEWACPETPTSGRFSWSSPNAAVISWGPLRCRCQNGVRRVSYVKGKRGKHAGLLPAAAVRGGEEEEWVRSTRDDREVLRKSPPAQWGAPGQNGPLKRSCVRKEGPGSGDIPLPSCLLGIVWRHVASERPP